MPEEENKPAPNQSLTAMQELMEQEPAPEIKEDSAPEKQAGETDAAATEGVSANNGSPDSPKEDSPQGAAKPEGELGEAQSKPDGDAALPSEAHKKFQEELDQIKLRSDAAPKTNEQFNQVKAKAAEQFRARQTLEQEVLDLRAKASESEGKLKEATEKFTPEKEQEYQKLKDWYENYGLIDDPQWTQPYDQKIRANDESIIGILKQKILPEGSAKYIMDRGGPSQFRYSSDLMPSNFKNDDGSQMTHKDYWDKYIENSQHLDKASRDEMDDLFREIRGVSREKNQKVQDVQKNRSTYVEQTKQQQEQAQKDWAARVTAHANKYAESLGDAAKVKTIPANATTDEIKAIERHNSRIEKAKSISESLAIRQNEPEVWVETIVDAARARVQDDLIKEATEGREAAEKKVADLQKELEGIRKASSTAAKGIKPKEGPRKPMSNQTPEQVMSGYMREEGLIK